VRLIGSVYGVAAKTILLEFREGDQSRQQYSLENTRVSIVLGKADRVFHTCQYLCQSTPPFESLTNLPVAFVHFQVGFPPPGFLSMLRRRILVSSSHCSFMTGSSEALSWSRCFFAASFSLLVFFSQI